MACSMSFLARSRVCPACLSTELTPSATCLSNQEHSALLAFAFQFAAVTRLPVLSASVRMHPRYLELLLVVLPLKLRVFAVLFSEALPAEPCPIYRDKVYVSLTRLT